MAGEAPGRSAIQAITRPDKKQDYESLLLVVTPEMRAQLRSQTIDVSGAVSRYFIFSQRMVAKSYLSRLESHGQFITALELNTKEKNRHLKLQLLNGCK